MDKVTEDEFKRKLALNSTIGWNCREYIESMTADPNDFAFVVGDLFSWHLTNVKPSKRDDEIKRIIELVHMLLPKKDAFLDREGVTKTN